MRFVISLLLLVASSSSAQNPVIKQVHKYIVNKQVKGLEVLFISIKKQKLYHIKNNEIIKSYVISSSLYGTGNEAGSNKTPLGLHKIKQKHGDKTPINGKMIGRKYSGEIATIYSDNTKSKTDDITSRILWLEGLEHGVNKGEGIDSFMRYIYIHGTSEEGKIGVPASHGCIRMKNKDVIDLYKAIEVGTLVLIL